MNVEVEPRLLTTALRRARLMRCALRGLDAKMAARVVGCSHATARQVYADPAFRRRVRQGLEGVLEGADAAYVAKQLTLHEQIEHKAQTAFDILTKIMEDDRAQPALRVKVAQDLLDRNPETQSGHTVTAREEFVEALDAARLAASEIDNVINIRRNA